MFRSYGLYTHIQANRIRSILLLAGFVALLHALLFSILLLLNAFMTGGTFEDILYAARDQFAGAWPVAMIAAAAWFVIAFLIHQAMIRSATGARGVSRQEAPQLYNALENLCISRGIPMPRLQIIDTPALNAYAAGLREGDYVIAVTRGLIDTLNPAELEAVLGHELTHIRNRDSQLMVIAVIFAGIFGFFADLFVRGWDFPYGWSPRDKRQRGQDDWDDSGGGSSGGRGGSSCGGGGGAIIAVIVAIAIIIISWGVSTLIRFALSRSREYLADAGSVELTKNPDAMISALRKIERNAAFDVPSRMEAFFIENPLKSRITGLLATHPSVDARVEALELYAQGRDLTPDTPPPA
jgi:heat shock protein HtpX